MDEGNSIIYGLEHQARSLAPQCAETNAVRFLIGTQNLKPNTNQIHVVELEEETGTLHTKVFKHEEGEIWHMRCSPHDASILSTCYNSYNPDLVQSTMGCTLFRLPTLQVIPKDGDDLTSFRERNMESLENFCSFEMEIPNEDVKCCEFHLTDPAKICLVSESRAAIWDIASGDPKKGGELLTIIKPLVGDEHAKFGGGKWNPHQNGWQFALLQNTHVRCYDTRGDVAKPVWSIKSAHTQQVRNLDFNPNRQFHLATVGDDGALKIWDHRNTSEPLESRTDHSHWIWCVRYNSYHDQLLVTGSSDARALLTCINLPDTDVISLSPDDESPTESDKERLSNGVLQSCEQHEDSVYCVEWSSADPWTFASLSYDGRLIMSKVPRHHKYKILL